jgi:hypothetical protein
MIRWLMTRHAPVEFANAFITLCTDTQCVRKKHGEKGGKPGLINKDESDVAKVVEVILQNQISFDVDSVSSTLFNIISGQVASPAVANSLAGFLDLGRRKQSELMEKRQVEGEKTVNF